jgi:hypothetical protein
MNWRFIMIHHSLTKDSQTVSWQAIRKYHVETNGWLDIGYHFGIELINDQYEVLVGRPLDTPGAHCKENQMNNLAIGVCCVGNYDLEEPPAAMIAVLSKRLLVPLMRQFSIAKEQIVFHRDFATYKSCPGNLFQKKHIVGV